MAIKYQLGIHWYRRDLRISDHLVLQAAAQACAAVCPLYIATTWQAPHDWTGPNRQHFLCECLASLAADLPAIHGRLIVRSGPPLDVLERLIRETGAQAVFFQQDPDPHGRAVEISVESLCRELGVAVHAMHDVSLRPPQSVLTATGLPYRVFTPYSKSWLAASKAVPVAQVGVLHTPSHIPSEPLPTLAHWGLLASAASQTSRACEIMVCDTLTSR